MGQIPVIDFAPFRDGSPEDAEATAKKIFEAFRDVGFAYLKNHGVPQEVVDEAFSWVTMAMASCKYHATDALVIEQKTVRPSTV